MPNFSKIILADFVDFVDMKIDFNIIRIVNTKCRNKGCGISSYPLRKWQHKSKILSTQSN